MIVRSRMHLALLILTMLAVSCAGPAPSQSGQVARGGDAAQSSQPRTFKRVTAAINGQPTSVISRTNTAQFSIPGSNAVEQLLNGGLTELNGDGRLQPQLAEAVPTIENGLWKVFPDGRMETTWNLRPNVVWHDGAPMTSADFVFTAMVDQDPELAIARHGGYQSVESVVPVDPTTITVRWSKPYIDADSMFTGPFAVPLPSHLLEEPYRQDKAGFLSLPFWNTEFVGTGPFSMKEFSPGSHVIVQANDKYAHGRPKIDEIEVKFISDLNTLVTNILAGAVELSLGRGFSIEQVLLLQAQWPDGSAQVRPRSWIVLNPQLLNPTPAIIGDVRFRRALMHATDRQALVDSLQAGRTGVAHVYLAPSEPDYKDVENAVVRYEYDQRKAAGMIEELGYNKGPDGTYRDTENQRLSVELRTWGLKVSDDATNAVADEWSRFGVATEPFIVPTLRIQDREFSATFPSFFNIRQPNAASDVARLRGSQTALPENRFVGINYSRYMNPEFDAMIDRYLTTVPRPERIQALRAVMHHISDQLNVMGLFYDAEIVFISNRLRNITARETGLWTIQDWDTR